MQLLCPAIGVIVFALLCRHRWSQLGRRPRGGSRAIALSLMLSALGCGAVQSGAPGDAGVADDVGGSGDAAGSGDPRGDFTLTASATSVDVPIAGTATVRLSIARTGPTGDVMLSAPNPPAGITATFTPNPVPAGATTSDVTIAVAGGTPAGTSTLTITGSGGGRDRTVRIAVTAQTINVFGTVRGGVAGVTVRLVGRPAVTSGAGGSFAFAGVSPPYDLYTVGASGFVGSATPTITYYRGLTRPDPIVIAPQPIVMTLPRISTGTVTGTRSGTSDTTNPLTVVWISSGTATVTPPSAYSFTATWPQASTYSGVLFGFQFSRRPTGAPDVFTGYGAVQATLAMDVTNTVNLPLAAPATAAITGTISVPSGFPNPTLSLSQQIHVPGGAEGSVLLWSGQTTDATATIPLVGAGKAGFAASAILNGASTSFAYPALAEATDVTFALRAPQVQTAPLDRAVGVNATTPFSWSTTPNTIYQLTLRSTTTTGTQNAIYQQYTAATSATLPEIPELPLPLNQSFAWQVSGRGPSATVDDAASATEFTGASSIDFTGTPHWFTVSTSRALTTAQ